VSRITVIGGTGYAGSAIVAEAAGRGHQVTALSRSLPDPRIPDVAYIQGDVANETVLSTAVEGADIVVAALAPRGPLAGTFRDVYRAIARSADARCIPVRGRRLLFAASSAGG
jgi:putative NADH-flavin reductase